MNKPTLITQHLIGDIANHILWLTNTNDLSSPSHISDIEDMFYNLKEESGLEISAESELKMTNLLTQLRVEINRFNEQQSL